MKVCVVVVDQGDGEAPSLTVFKHGEDAHEYADHMNRKAERHSGMSVYTYFLNVREERKEVKS